MQNLSSVFHYFLVTQMANRSQTSTGLSVYVYGVLHKVLYTASNFFASKTKSVMFLSDLKRKCLQVFELKSLWLEVLKMESRNLEVQISCRRFQRQLLLLLLLQCRCCCWCLGSRNDQVWPFWWVGPQRRGWGAYWWYYALEKEKTKFQGWTAKEKKNCIKNKYFIMDGKGR